MVVNKIEKDKLNLSSEEKDLIEQGQNALSLYAYIYEFENFHPNIDINYKNNRILYYNFLIYSIYNYMVKRDVRKEQIKLSFNLERFKCYSNLREYIELIFDKDLDDGKNGEDASLDTTPKEISEELIKKIKILYLIIFSGSSNESIEEIQSNFKNLEKNEDKLSKEYVIDFFKKNKIPKSMTINIEEDKFSIIKNNKITRFYYDCFGKTFLASNFTKNLTIKQLKNISFENCLFDSFNKQNYFSQNNPFFNKLIRKIISSNFFKDCFTKFTNISSDIEYFLNDEEIINYIISKILFVPIDEEDLNGTQAITTNYDLTIMLSGFPRIKRLCNKEIVLLELARKIIQILHELMHFIKRFLNIFSGNIISGNAFESEKEYNKQKIDNSNEENKNEAEAITIFEYII
jgi:hypothetical protein